MTPSKEAASNDFLWRKARSSVNNGACVEVAVLTEGVAVRDSKSPDGPILTCSREEWRTFLRHARAGVFNG
jgi:Domain of unknown function (DUF397)